MSTQANQLPPFCPRCYEEVCRCPKDGSLVPEPCSVGHGIALHKIEHKSPGMACDNFKPYTEEREVRVMAVADGYAMVRRKGCMPYIAKLSELHPLNDQAEARP